LFIHSFVHSFIHKTSTHLAVASDVATTTVWLGGGIATIATKELFLLGSSALIVVPWTGSQICSMITIIKRIIMMIVMMTIMIVMMMMTINDCDDYNDDDCDDDDCDDDDCDDDDDGNDD